MLLIGKQFEILNEKSRRFQSGGIAFAAFSRAVVSESEAQVTSSVRETGGLRECDGLGGGPY